MKKYMIAAATFLLFAGITNAQVAQKQPGKTTTTKEVAIQKKTNEANKATVSNVTPQSSAAKKAPAKQTAIKRKHHHKKSPAKKTTTK